MPHSLRHAIFAVLAALVSKVCWGQFVDAPQTVPRGEWLIETDIATASFDKFDGVKTRSTALMVWQVTTGIVEDWDIQLGLESWLEERITGSGVDEKVSGMGQAYIRTKWNFWKTERAGLAILPYYKFRSTAARSIRPSVSEFGLIIPYSLTLSDKWQLYSQAEFDWLDNGAGGRDCWWSGYVTLQRTLSKEWFWYCETTSSAINARGCWSTMAGAGVIWQMTEKFSWDAALYVGLNETAPDWYPALRFVWSY